MNLKLLFWGHDLRQISKTSALQREFCVHHKIYGMIWHPTHTIAASRLVSYVRENLQNRTLDNSLRDRTLKKMCGLINLFCAHRRFIARIPLSFITRQRANEKNWARLDWSEYTNTNWSVWAFRVERFLVLKKVESVIDLDFFFVLLLQ